MLRQIEALGCSPLEELGFSVHPVAQDIIEKARVGGAPPGLQDRLPSSVHPDALDLLSRMLVVRPDDRITVETALEHPFLRELHSQMEEPSCKSEFDSSFESQGGVCDDHESLRRLMREEMTLLIQRVSETVNIDAGNAMDISFG